MNKIYLLLLLFFSLSISAQNLTKVSFGKIERLENFSSQFVSPRNIDVWLPEGYNTANKYNVVYMHDGQMLFDSTQTWNKKEWCVDEIFSKLIAENKIEPSIIVAIWNTPERITEYFPNKIFENIDDELQKSILEKYGNGKKISSDNYLKFIVIELKPFIDKNYATHPEKEHTAIIGSSMGGLISAYAICEYPEIFGGAACLSTAWFSFVEPNYAIPMAAFKYFEKNLPSPTDHKIYFDYGTGESDKPYELTQSFVDLIAKGKKYNEDTYKSLVFENAVHDEIAWSRRLDIPLVFLIHP
jgi:predicted alpha/beta superfamily hydrolase